jgi:formiminotetrahydrofolate cyclodeaminase
MLTEKRIDEFLQELGSVSPAPGGGSVAAMAGALAAQLAAMVCRLTIANVKYSQAHGELGELLRHAVEAADRLTKYIDEDTTAFQRVMACYNLPKTTEGEQTIRRDRIQEALKEAARLPLEVAQNSLAVLRYTKAVLLQGTPQAASDAAVAGLMAYAAIMGAVYNVRINVTAIKDQQFAEHMHSKLDELMSAAEVLNCEIAEITTQRIG